MTDPGRPPAAPAPTGAPQAAPTPPGGWTLWSVFRRDGAPLADGLALVSALDEVPDDVVVRGFYDLTGMRADADLMVWLHGDSPAALQAELRRLRRTAELGALAPSWSAMGVHRPAEFSADHQPAFLAGADEDVGKSRRGAGHLLAGLSLTGLGELARDDGESVAHALAERNGVGQGSDRGRVADAVTDEVELGRQPQADGASDEGRNRVGGRQVGVEDGEVDGVDLESGQGERQALNGNGDGLEAAAAAARLHGQLLEPAVQLLQESLRHLRHDHLPYAPRQCSAPRARSSPRGVASRVPLAVGDADPAPDQLEGEMEALAPGPLVVTLQGEGEVDEVAAGHPAPASTLVATATCVTMAWTT